MKVRKWILGNDPRRMALILDSGPGAIVAELIEIHMGITLGLPPPLGVCSPA